MLQKFSRYEFKYLVEKSVAIRIRQEIAHFMSEDPFTGGKSENVYYVRSLYFENKHFHNFYEKIDGVKNRNKYRLRTYSPFLFGSDVFLELKNRNNNRVSKVRESIQLEDLEPLLCCQHAFFDTYQDQLFQGLNYEIIKHFNF